MTDPPIVNYCYFKDTDRVADPIANKESDTPTLQPLGIKLDNTDIMTTTGDFAIQATTRDLGASEHSQRIE